MSQGTKIDFEKEVFDLIDPYKYYGSMWSDARGKVIAMAKSIAARVEEETIQRFMMRAAESGFPLDELGKLAGMSRLYALPNEERKSK